MSSQHRSRAFEEGRVKALRRMKQPLAPQFSGGASPYIPSRGAQRRADRVALLRQARQLQEDRNDE